jgi:hypothetical protein
MVHGTFPQIIIGNWGELLNCPISGGKRQEIGALAEANGQPEKTIAPDCL